MILNLNDHVTVRLNDYGRRIWREHFARYPSTAAQADDVSMRQPLHYLFYVFGPFIRPGSELPFEIEIHAPEPAKEDRCAE